MATVSPAEQNPNAGATKQEHWLWEGVANDDTITMLEMPHVYAHVCVQLRNTVPASTVISLVGGVDNDASKAAPILDAAGSAITLSAENAMVFLTGGVPPFLGFTCTGGTAGDMDVHLVRKPF